MRFFLQFRLTGYVLFIIGIIVSGIVNKILVDARDSEEYRKRVQYLYDFLNKNGLKMLINATIIRYNGLEIKADVSLGLSIMDSHEDIKEAIDKADKAMYTVKKEKK